MVGFEIQPRSEHHIFVAPPNVKTTLINELVAIDTAPDMPVGTTEDFIKRIMVNLCDIGAFYKRWYAGRWRVLGKIVILEVD